MAVGSEIRRYATFTALVESHLALFFFLVGFPTRYWLEGGIYQGGTKLVSINIGLFRSMINSTEMDTEKFMQFLGYHDQYDKVHVSIVLESITLPLLALSVFLVYAVAIRKNIRVLYAAVVCLAIGGLLAITAPAYLEDNLVDPESVQTMPGYSFGLEILSGCLALASAGTLVYALAKGELRTIHAGHVRLN